MGLGSLVLEAQSRSMKSPRLRDRRRCIYRSSSHTKEPKIMDWISHWEKTFGKWRPLSQQRQAWDFSRKLLWSSATMPWARSYSASPSQRDRPIFDIGSALYANTNERWYRNIISQWGCIKQRKLIRNNLSTRTSPSAVDNADSTSRAKQENLIFGAEKVELSVIFGKLGVRDRIVSIRKSIIVARLLEDLIGERTFPPLIIQSF